MTLTLLRPDNLMRAAAARIDEMARLLALAEIELEALRDEKELWRHYAESPMPGDPESVWAEAAQFSAALTSSAEAVRQSVARLNMDDPYKKLGLEAVLRLISTGMMNDVNC